MLVLSRFIDEKVVVNDDIIVTVTDIRSGGKVRLGFEAPAGVPIYRKEIYDQIRRDGRLPKSLVSDPEVGRLRAENEALRAEVRDLEARLRRYL